MKIFGPGGLPGPVRPPLTGRLLRRSAASSSCTNRREDVARQSSGRHTGGDPPRPCEQASDAPLPRPYVVPSLPSSIGQDWEASPCPCGGGEPVRGSPSRSNRRKRGFLPCCHRRVPHPGPARLGALPGVPSALLADLSVAGLGDRRRLRNSLQAPLTACCHQLLELRGVHLLQLFQGAGDALLDSLGGHTERLVQPRMRACALFKSPAAAESQRSCTAWWTCSAFAASAAATTARVPSLWSWKTRAEKISS